MGPRPLIQLYDAPVVPYEVDSAFGDPGRAWRQHRARFLDRLSALTEDEWRAGSRCADWSVRDVVVHLITTDQFWFVSLQSALAGSPTEILRGFDPTEGTRGVMEPLAELGGAEVLAKIAETTELLGSVLEGIGPADWATIGESPLGQVPVQLVMAHALWDSWLHERDVLVALGRDTAVEVDEVTLAVTYALLMAAVQGGMDEAVGGTDVTLGFEDLPGSPIRVEAGAGFRVSPGNPDEAAPSGRAVDLLDRYSGRLGDHAEDPTACGRADAPASLRPHLLAALDVL